ncbi:MAG: type II secretion system minor pseudopilin GspJ [Pseudomonadota bacterium]
MRINRGFTLVEVLVTIAIFALLGLGSFSILDQVLSTKKQSEQRFEKIEQLQFSWLLMEQDLRQAVAKPTRPNMDEVVHQYVTNDVDNIDSESGVLAFVRSGFDNPGLRLPRSELQPIVYRVRDGELQRLSFTFVNDTSGEPQVQTLLTDVESFQVRFYRQAGQADDNSGVAQGWNTSWSTTGDMPAAIEVTINSRVFGEMYRVFLTSGVASSKGSDDDS